MKKYLLGIVLILVFHGCGSDSKGSSPLVIDMAEYLPSMSLNKQYTDVVKLNGDLNSTPYLESIVVEPNRIMTKKDNILKSVTTIDNDELDELLIGDSNRTKIYKRDVSIGDEVSHYKSVDESRELSVGTQVVGEEHIEVVESCTFDSIVDNYEIYFYEYKNYDGEHDIIKLKCVSNKSVNTIIDPEYLNTVAFENGLITSKDNISYVYLQKGLGRVATIDNDCLVDITDNIIDDTADESECIGEQYHHILYYPEY
jgi:hypothetical protein